MFEQGKTGASAKEKPPRKGRRELLLRIQALF